MQKIWNKIKDANPQKTLQLHSELVNISKNKSSEDYLVLAQLLANRGIFSVQEATQFNNFKVDQLHDPFLMKGMDLAVDRILGAIENGEKIMIYGDYDVDGTTSVALMVTFLTNLTSNISYYIPDRYTEGYGISIQGIDEAKSQNVQLIIALDCGIKAIKQIEYANSLAVDFIICDHHTPGTTVPNCVAVLDPKQTDCTYPYKELSGAAIGFKLCQAIASRQKMLPETTLDLIDLVAISLACDIVPLTGENRVLAALGLQLINEGTRRSIAILLGEKEPNQKFTISDLVFKAGPKINAAGRMASGVKAVNLLISDQTEELEKFNFQISQHNTDRKKEDERITIEALDILKSESNSLNTNVLYQENWHKGVIGIVASRVIEHHYKPTVILTSSQNDCMTGSVRSVKGFNVYNALDACTSEIEQFGGHKYAAGLTIRKDNFSAFKKAFETAVTQQMETDQFIPELKYELELSLNQISFKLKSLIDKLAPFGPSNSTPVFISKNILNSGNSRLVGSDKKHLKLELVDPESGTIIQGIGFGLGKYFDQISQQIPFDIIYTLDINHWKNKQTIQLMVKDIRFRDMQ